jgi:hypothetical protein
MKEKSSFEMIPSEGVETPLGHLYYPPKQGTQVLSVLAAFFTAIFLGWIISSIPGDLSEFGSGVIYFIYLIVFILGYSAWISWLNVIVFDSIKWPILKTIFRLLIKKEKPKSVHDFLPPKEKIIEILVRAQKAAKIFYRLSWPIGVFGGIVSMFLSNSTNSILMFVLISSTSVCYGYALFYLGRRGYFPFPEE